MNWTIIQINECFITRETGKVVRIRLPRWLDDVVGTFWLPAGCLKRDKFPPELCIPESMKIEISYKKPTISACSETGKSESTHRKRLKNSCLKSTATTLCAAIMSLYSKRQNSHPFTWNRWRN